MLRKATLLAVILLALVVSSLAQVNSPRVLSKGQVDTTDLKSFAQGIYRVADAITPREKADAIWRFFLTDGRFVRPGFWYHIAGWAYEEPEGEVLDPIKLLNSYGFGLCYQIAPLLQAVYLAGGFEDARVWFLTNHTVAEVFYDGAYHHYDSDMLGYSVIGEGDPKRLPVASVSQLAADGTIITGKLKSPKEVDNTKVEYPWYPADLQEAAMGGLADLFTTTSDNWLFAGTRYPLGHSMDFMLRPGESVTRYFEPEEPGLFYLPYSFDGVTWTEFPKEVPEYAIRAEDGPRSQKDSRRWATGRIQYTPVLSDPDAFYAGIPGNGNLRIAGPQVGRPYLSRNSGNQPASAIFEIVSPWVLIDAGVTTELTIRGQAGRVDAAISTDGGLSWVDMGAVEGVFDGKWEPKVPLIHRSEHGTLNPVAGKYGFLLRLQLLGSGAHDSVLVRKLEITARFQHNPRTLPALINGDNQLEYRTGGPDCRHSIPLALDQLGRLAVRNTNIKCVSERGQQILWPEEGQTGEIILPVTAPGRELRGFDVGARFLDLRDRLAPNKLTAETRPTGLGAGNDPNPARSASIGWSISPGGPFKTLWQYHPVEGNRLLRWPEVDVTVSSIPPGTKRVYLRYVLRNMGMDSVRLASRVPVGRRSGSLEITHVWLSNGIRQEHRQELTRETNYSITIAAPEPIVNHALILSCPR